MVDVGNILPIGKIPEGTMICNIELRPGDGGKLSKSSGVIRYCCHTHAERNDNQASIGKIKVRGGLLQGNYRRGFRSLAGQTNRS